MEVEMKECKEKLTPSSLPWLCELHWPGTLECSCGGWSRYRLLAGGDNTSVLVMLWRDNIIDSGKTLQEVIRETVCLCVLLTAIAMAMLASVTVSMGEETKGVFMVICLVSAEVRSWTGRYIKAAFSKSYTDVLWNENTRINYNFWEAIIYCSGIMSLIQGNVCDVRNTSDNPDSPPGHHPRLV